MLKRLMAAVLAVCLFAIPLPSLALEGVAYEVFVRSYADSDGDGVGDLNGLTQKLDYLQGLGVKTLWLMPISPSPTYHKYDVTDYTAIDPEYGSLADFDALVKAADEKGIGLILDLVLNHSSDEHPWFLSACASLRKGELDDPYIDYYHFSKEKKAGYHAVPGTQDWYYEGAFTPDMPDLNVDSEAVRAEFAKIVDFWLKRGVKGFRLDAVIHYTEGTAGNAAFLAWLMDACRAVTPDCYLVGEAWKEAAEIESLYQSGISSLFNFPFGQQDGALVKTVKNGTGAAYASRLCEWNAAIRKASPNSTDAVFLSNHDMGRSAGFLMLDNRKMKSAAALYLLSPGTPYIYYGEELGMTGSGRDENKRLPMLWDTENESAQCKPPEAADQAQRQKLGVKQQDTDEASLLSFYKQAIALRALCPALDTACPTLIETEYPALAAYAVSDENGKYQIYQNLGGEEISLPMDACTLLGGLAALEGAPTLENSTLVLPAYSACLLLEK